MPSKDKYTDPKLRDEIKEELKASDKGGAPGQWSARKAQMMAAEYKKRGGDYTTDKKDKDESQQNLTNWGEEEWQTKDGEGKAKQEDGTEKRYLPKKAWEQMSEKEKEETDQKKQAESKEGKQYVSNTPKAKDSRKKAQKKDDDSKEDEGKEQKNGATGTRRSSRNQNKSSSADKDEEKSAKSKNAKGNSKEDDNEEAVDKEEEESNEESSKDKRAGQKRKDSEEHGGSKKQKGNSGKGTIGSKHMDASEPAQQGSKDRLPKEGQKVTWKAMPGWVPGKVKEILKKSKKVDGKQVKASENDPKLVLVSDSSGKICVHKPEACYYDDE